MKNKRGLSGVLNTVLMILLVLVAIGTIWVAVNTFVIKGTSKISLEQYTLDLEIKSVRINYSTGIAVVRVVRNPGAGELTGIKFIVEDDKNADVFHEDVSDFYEFAERVFSINLNDSDILEVQRVTKISIAPVFVTEAGGSNVEGVGSVADSLGDLEAGTNFTYTENGGSSGNDGAICEEDSECGTDEWVPESEECSADKGSINQQKDIYTCQGGFCVSGRSLMTKEDCPTGSLCYDAQCISEPIPCTEATVQNDCGVDDFVGMKGCDQEGLNVIQSYQDFSCVEEVCVSDLQTVVVENCSEQEMVCYRGECFVPLECSVNADCWDTGIPNGEICNAAGECVLEDVVEIGTVYTVWPYGIAEYFDSFNLSLKKSMTNLTAGMFMVFPGSDQSGCLQIAEFNTPTFDGGISYIRFNKKPTDVKDGDNYEVWETNYTCNFY